jgi:hypothetical protein
VFDISLHVANILSLLSFELKIEFDEKKVNQSRENLNIIHTHPHCFDIVIAAAMKTMPISVTIVITVAKVALSW